MEPLIEDAQDFFEIEDNINNLNISLELENLGSTNILNLEPHVIQQSQLNEPPLNSQPIVMLNSQNSIPIPQKKQMSMPQSMPMPLNNKTLTKPFNSCIQNFEDYDFEELFNPKNYYNEYFKEKKSEDISYKATESKKQWMKRNTQKLKELTYMNNIDINVLKNFNCSNISCKFNLIFRLQKLLQALFRF